ncbi:MAG TPA: hypothetical protein VNO35_21440 [Steroidobacteraceae bacterium]|nr:hypothetical protein [Steroidobacteraceae bacterium]
MSTTKVELAEWGGECGVSGWPVSTAEGTRVRRGDDGVRGSELSGGTTRPGR